MAYKLITKKTDPGHYSLFYGRGSKKISANIWLNDIAGGWQLRAGDPGCVEVMDKAPSDVGFKQKKQLQAAWLAWVEVEYKRLNDPPSTPEPPKLPPVPSLRDAGPPSLSPPVPATPPDQEPTPGERRADPFNCLFYTRTGPDGQMTPLGVLANIYEYHKRNKFARVRFDPLFGDVVRVLKREHPDGNYEYPPRD